MFLDEKMYMKLSTPNPGVPYHNKLISESKIRSSAFYRPKFLINQRQIKFNIAHRNVVFGRMSRSFPFVGIGNSATNLSPSWIGQNLCNLWIRIGCWIISGFLLSHIDNIVEFGWVCLWKGKCWLFGMLPSDISGVAEKSKFQTCPNDFKILWEAHTIIRDIHLAGKPYITQPALFREEKHNF